MNRYRSAKSFSVMFLILLGIAHITWSESVSRMLLFNKYPGVLHRGTISRTTTMVDSIAGVLQTFEWDSTSDSTFITSENLAEYEILFLNNNQQPAKLLSVEQQSAIEDFVRSGGSVMGCHSSINMGKHPWPFIVDSVFGAKEKDHHPVYEVLVVRDAGASVLPGVENLIQEFTIYNQWYTLEPNPRDVEGVHVIYSLVESTFVNTKDEPLEDKMYMGDHPIAWVRDLPWGGRVFYTELTHHRQFVEPDHELYPTVFNLYKEGIGYLTELSSAVKPESPHAAERSNAKQSVRTGKLVGFGEKQRTSRNGSRYILNGRKFGQTPDVSPGVRVDEIE